MRPIPCAYAIPVEHAIFGSLLGLTIYVWEGSLGAAVVIGIVGALLSWTIDEDQKAHRDPDEEPHRAREALRERFWPPALANALRQIQGWRRLGAIVFDCLAVPLILLPTALAGVASGDEVRAWLGAALVGVVVVELATVAVALVIRPSKGGASTASPPDPPSA